MGLLAALAALFLARERGEITGILAALRTADPAWLGALVALAGAAQFLAALELRLLLARLGVRVPLLPIVEAQLQRSALATVVPVGGPTGAVLLVRRLARYGASTDTVILTLVMASVVGHASFLVVLAPALIWLSAEGVAGMPILLSAGALLLVVAALTGSLALLLRGARLPLGLDARLPARVVAFAADARAHDVRPRDLAAPFAAALAVDATGIGIVWIALAALGQHATIGTAAVGYAVGTLFLLLAPVFQGIGVVEISMAIALERLGVPKAEAIAAAVLARVAEVWLPLLLGAAVTARGSGRVRGWPARLPAAAAALSGAVSVISVLAPSLPARYDRLDDYTLVNPVDSARTLALASGILLLLLSHALLRRNRVAWAAATVVTTLSVVAHVVKRHDEAAALPAAACLVLLLLYRRRFRVRSDVPTMRRGLVGLMAILGLAAGYGTLGFWLLDRRAFGIEFSLARSVRETLTLFVGLGESGLAPRTRYAAWFLDSVSLVGLLALAGAGICLARPVVWRRVTYPRERAAAAAIVDAWGDSSLDAFKLWPDKHLFFSSTGRGVIAYGASGGVAVALGDPVAADETERSRTVEEFAELCDANGWRMAFHQASPDRLPTYAALGLTALKIGEEAVVDLSTFTFAGNAGKGLRSALNRLERGGYLATLHWPPLDDGLVVELRGVSNQWLTVAGRRERAFTMGIFDEGYIRGTPTMVLAGPDGRAVAFANLVRDGVPGEATIDLMRYRPDAPNGVMDGLFGRLLPDLRNAGFQRFSLGMAPWSEVGTRPGAPGRERVVGLLAQHLERFFSVKGLRAYKDKFHPTWEPRYLVYEGDAALPAVALALVRLTERARPVAPTPADVSALTPAWPAEPASGPAIPPNSPRG